MNCERQEGGERREIEKVNQADRWSGVLKLNGDESKGQKGCGKSLGEIGDLPGMLLFTTAAGGIHIANDNSESMHSSCPLWLGNPLHLGLTLGSHSGAHAQWQCSC